MNCKPGDIAIVIPPSKNAGMIVNVLEAAPPDHKHPTYNPSWMVKSIGGKMQGYRDGLKVMALEGCMPDSWLRPVSGLPVHKETADEATP